MCACHATAGIPFMNKLCLRLDMQGAGTVATLALMASTGLAWDSCPPLPPQPQLFLQGRGTVARLLIPLSRLYQIVLVLCRPFTKQQTARGRDSCPLLSPRPPGPFDLQGTRTVALPCLFGHHCTCMEQQQLLDRRYHYRGYSPWCIRQCHSQRLHSSYIVMTLSIEIIWLPGYRRILPQGFKGSCDT